MPSRRTTGMLAPSSSSRKSLLELLPAEMILNILKFVALMGPDRPSGLPPKAITRASHPNMTSRHVGGTDVDSEGLPWVVLPLLRMGMCNKNLAALCTDTLARHQQFYLNMTRTAPNFAVCQSTGAIKTFSRSVFEFVVQIPRQGGHIYSDKLDNVSHGFVLGTAILTRCLQKLPPQLTPPLDLQHRLQRLCIRPQLLIGRNAQHDGQRDWLDEFDDDALQPFEAVKHIKLILHEYETFSVTPYIMSNDKVEMTDAWASSKLDREHCAKLVPFFPLLKTVKISRELKYSMTQGLRDWYHYPEPSAVTTCEFDLSALDDPEEKAQLKALGEKISRQREKKELLKRAEKIKKGIARLDAKVVEYLHGLIKKREEEKDLLVAMLEGSE